MAFTDGLSSKSERATEMVETMESAKLGFNAAPVVIELALHHIQFLAFARNLRIGGRTFASGLSNGGILDVILIEVNSSANTAAFIL